ncbi:MAG TPA: Holliday junction branch migration DNA helicase RuvB [Candidatus Binatia bacterium]|nr:Holliday junction branch migration DNA helicase RuvB [Candidatus Binatia bacterium]
MSRPRREPESPVSQIATDEELRFEASLRPESLADYVGQDPVRENLAVAIAAARERGEPLDHILLSGPPGLGKTSLAQIVAREMGVQCRKTQGPAVERGGDLAALLSDLESGDVLFIDEIHGLPRKVEEVLYPAMEDFELDLIVGQGPTARSMRLALKPFTLIGATTRAGMLNAPLRDRFGSAFRLEYYRSEQLARILARSARILNVVLAPAGADEIARRSRGTPRIANRQLKWVRDYAQVHRPGKPIDADTASRALELHRVDPAGLEPMDHAILLAVLDRFAGGPVGIESLGALLGEERETIEAVYEPFLVQSGYLERTPRGRVATELAYRHFGRDVPAGPRQGRLL